MKKEKKKSSYIFNLIIIPILIFNFFILFNNYKNGYFIGKIESINKSEDTITIEVSPIKSTSSFARKVKSNHKIEFKDSISISGLTSRGKKKKELTPKELHEKFDSLINDFKIGDSIIFEADNYSQSDYKIDINSLAIDLGN